jgi:hypothetical protein
VIRHIKLRDGLNVEPIDCRLAEKTNKIKINGKEHMIQIVEGRDKNQVAGLELTETFLLCGRAAQKTHIWNIIVFFHPMLQIQVAPGKFDAATTEASVTRLESELSFLQVKATMTLQERIWQVKGYICENRRQIAQLRLESIAGAKNPYSLIQIFGHQVT